MILYKYLKPIVFFLFIFCFNVLIVYAETTDCPKNSEIQQLKERINDCPKNSEIQQLKEKIIRLEAIQETDTNSLTLFSILISAVIAGSILISGGFVYFSNKRALTEYKIKQDKIDSLNNSLLETQDRQDARLKDMENLSNNFTNELKLHDQNLHSVGKIFEVFVKYTVNQVEELNRIANEYKDLHFETFNTLNYLLFDFYDNRITDFNSSQKVIILTSILLLKVIEKNKSNNDIPEDNNNYEIALKNTIEELDKIMIEIFNEEVDDATKSNTINTATKNLEKCLKYSDVMNQEQIELINRLIEKLQRI